MKKYASKKLAGFIVILHMLFFAVWYINEASIFQKTIAEITVRTVAYDPRDLLSGQYIRLNYSFSNINFRAPITQNTPYPEWSKEIRNNSSFNPKRRIVWVILDIFPIKSQILRI